MTVASGAVLMGAGSIGGATTVNGTLSPGASGIGTLTVANDLTLTSGAVTTMEISKTSGACDKVAGVSTMTYAGTLTVTNLSGTLAVGDSFTLFSASSYSGSFTTLNLPALTGGLKWDTSKLAVNGCITVGYDVAITTQPSNQSAAQGVSATFTVAATGVPSPAYQWQLCPSGGAWAGISGATSASYTTAALASANNGSQYRCVVTNGINTLTSNAATLTVTSNALPSFTTQPADCTLTAAGLTASFTAAASGPPSPTYQWQVSTDGGSTWGNVSGATSATYSFTSASGDDGKCYRCVATNSVGTAQSSSAQLVIYTTNPTWINTAGGSWPTTSNWYGGVVGTGTGVTADFSRLNLTANATVTLDAATTIGNLKFGDTTPSNGWTLSTGTAGPLTLAVSAGFCHYQPFILCSPHARG